MVNYISTKRIESKRIPGVAFRIRRMSLAGRMRMLEEVWETTRKLEFHQAGESLEDQIQVQSISSITEAAYVRWGLEAIENLSIDGQEATPELLLQSGPELLTREVAEAVRAETFLSEDERKN